MVPILATEAITVMRAGARQMVPRILSLFEEQWDTEDQQLKQQLATTLSAFFPLLTPKVGYLPLLLNAIYEICLKGSQKLETYFS